MAHPPSITAQQPINMTQLPSNTANSPAQPPQSNAPPPPNGYTKLAALMGAHPELASFRRFGALNAKNLLYLQAELIYLENKLQRCVDKDNASGHLDRILYDTDWQSLFDSGTTAGGNGEQWETVVRIRGVLKEYNEALLSAQQLAQQDGPLARDMGYLQQWMKRTDMGYVYLLGADGDVYEKPDLKELVNVKCKPGKNSLAARVVADFTVRVWRKMFPVDLPPDMYSNTIHYSDSVLKRAGEIVGMICASMLPILAIVILYFLQSMGWRLGAIASFTFIFSAVLGVFSNGRRIEIFAATAGFAAVQVVFVSATPGISGDGAKN